MSVIIGIGRIYCLLSLLIFIPIDIYLGKPPARHNHHQRVSSLLPFYNGLLIMTFGLIFVTHRKIEFGNVVVQYRQTLSPAVFLEYRHRLLIVFDGEQILVLYIV